MSDIGATRKAATRRGALLLALARLLAMPARAAPTKRVQAS